MANSLDFFIKISTNAKSTIENLEKIQAIALSLKNINVNFNVNDEQLKEKIESIQKDIKLNINADESQSKIDSLKIPEIKKNNSNISENLNTASNIVNAVETSHVDRALESIKNNIDPIEKAKKNFNKINNMKFNSLLKIFGASKYATYLRTGGAIAGIALGLKMIYSSSVKANRELSNMKIFNDVVNISARDADMFGRSLERVGGNANNIKNFIANIKTQLGGVFTGDASGLLQALAKIGAVSDKGSISVFKDNGELKTARDLIGDLADRFSSMDKQKALNFARILGLTPDVLSFLEKGRSGIDKIFATTEQSPLLDDSNFKNVEKINNALVSMSQSLTKLKYDFLQTFSSSIISSVNALSSAFDKIDSAIKGSHVIDNAISNHSFDLIKAVFGFIPSSSHSVSNITNNNSSTTNNNYYTHFMDKTSSLTSVDPINRASDSIRSNY